MYDNEFQELLKNIKSEWNKAEEDIKIAEQVLNAVVTPSINELRYAGRRIVDSIVEYNRTDGDRTKALDLLRDAQFDCHRARHDAVDATTLRIALDLSLMVEHLGYDTVLRVHPDFADLHVEIDAIHEKAAYSRGHRDEREAVYATLESVDFPNLVRSYRKLKNKEQIMLAIASKERRGKLISNIGMYAGIALGIAGLVVGLVSLIK